VKQALGLDKPLATFERHHGRNAQKDNPQINARQLGRAPLGDHQSQDVLRLEPHNGDGDGEKPEEEGHPLELQAYQMLVA